MGLADPWTFPDWPLAFLGAFRSWQRKMDSAYGVGSRALGWAASVADTNCCIFPRGTRSRVIPQYMRLDVLFLDGFLGW